MESCEICGQSRSLEDGTIGVPCSGTCGRTVHAHCAAVTGVRLANADCGIFWFCDACRRGLHSLVPGPNTAADLPELPGEVWTEMFRDMSADQLLRMRLVCRRWRDIVTGSPALMAKLTVSFRGRKFKPDYLLPVSKASLRSFEGIDGRWWESFGQGLVEIEIKSRQYEDSPRIKLAGVLKMLKHTPNLRRLELGGCYLIDKHSVSADYCLEKVEKLVLDNIQNHAGRLKIFRKICPNVKSLVITWFEEDAVVDPVEVAKFVKGYRSGLEELEVNCLDQCLTELLKLDCLNLKKLSLTYNTPEEKEFKDDRKLMKLLRMHPSLEYLDVQGMLTFNNRNGMMLNELGQLLPNLKFLSIYASHVDPSFLHQIVKLQTFKMRGREKSLTSIRSSTFTDESHPNLRELHLTNVHLNDEHVLDTLPNLRILSLKKCKLDNWRAFLTALSALPLLQNLKLDIYKVACKPTPHTLHPKALTNLRYFKFTSHNTATKDTAEHMLVTLVTMVPNLWELHLKYIELGPEVLGAIFLNLTQLKRFVTSGCDTESVLSCHIRQQCCALEELNLK
ncbi:uncharacterized protein LOC119765565 [Culex quinquefasciatus]|uniref:uncharacterized protein LOC119765565 n=1 Tax=Culex quinquefasciatus TaxID=7176 RepID=UPI0018E2BBD6|nr:uncharacterized protein LOC119765565 [Culex quinquefasciatus]